MSKLESRISNLERAVPSEEDRIRGLIRRIIDPATKDAPMRFAEGEGMRFVAGDDEDEDQFRERIEAAMPKKVDGVWRFLMYPYRPESWGDQGGNE